MAEQSIFVDVVGKGELQFRISSTVENIETRVRKIYSLEGGGLVTLDGYVVLEDDVLVYGRYNFKNFQTKGE